VIIFDVEAGRASSMATMLARWGLSASHGPDPTGAAAALDREPPSAVVVVDPGDEETFSAAKAEARSRGIPVVAVIEPGADPRTLATRVRDYDDWVSASAIDPDLATRLLGLIGRKGATARTPVIEPRFLALAVHDLRTPLNVIGLTIRAIAQSAPVKNAEFEEDLTFLQENARQIEKMLAQIGDFCRLVESTTPPTGMEFDLCRFLGDLLDDRASRPGVEATPVTLDLSGSRPCEVSLDSNRARMAVLHALANAVAAAGPAPVRVRVCGDADRVRIEFVVDRPPPPTVTSIALRSDVFERLSGSAAERRGLDLAIATRISELFGGSARLEVDPGHRSTIVLDWPARIASDR